MATHFKWTLVLLLLAYSAPYAVSKQYDQDSAREDNDAWIDAGADFEAEALRNEGIEVPTISPDALPTDSGEEEEDDNQETYGTCPENKPYRYDGGRKCCAGDMENGEPDGPEGCNGSVLTLKSTCCAKKNKRCPFSMCVDKDTKDLVDEKRKEIAEKVSDFENPSQFEAYVRTEDALALYQYELLDDVMKSGGTIDLNDEDVAKIYNDKNLIQTLMTNGDISGNNWEKAMKNLARIMREDKNAKKGLKFRLAVAIALTFSTPLISTADKGEIDGIARYHTFAQWADEGVLMAPFYNLNIYEMRFVVHGSARDEEYVWARENVPDKFRSPDMIGRAVFDMVTYTPGNPLKGKNATLENMHIYGGVCGTFCKFGAGMSQAFGMPATPIGQPGHCAFTWLINGTEWQLANKVRGWDMSKIGGKVPHYTWKKAAPFMILMHEVQKDPQSFQISEKMRIISTIADPRFKCTLIESAIDVCPQNYGLYQELDGIISPQVVDENTVQLNMLPHVENFINREIEDIAWLKPVTSCGPSANSAYVLTRGGRKWSTNLTDSAWIEIDLTGTYSIDEVSIDWSSKSGKAEINYSVLAMINDELVQVRSQADDTDASKKFSAIPGWDGITSKIRFELRTSLDQIVISQIKVNGKASFTPSIVTLSRPVTANVNADQARNLVDGRMDTSWTSREKNSWIEIALNGICVLEEVLIDWQKKIRGTQTIQYIVGDEIYSEKTGKFRTLEMKGLATKLKILLTGAKSYSVREISATGNCFSMKDAMKMKVQDEVLDRHEICGNFVIEDISKVIDDAICDTCL